MRSSTLSSPLICPWQRCFKKKHYQNCLVLVVPTFYGVTSTMVYNLPRPRAAPGQIHTRGQKSACSSRHYGHSPHWVIRIWLMGLLQKTWTFVTKNIPPVGDQKMMTLKMMIHDMYNRVKTKFNHAYKGWKLGKTIGTVSGVSHHKSL